MTHIPLPALDVEREPGRLRSLAAYRIMDTPPDPRLDALTRTAARVLKVPTALVSLVDSERQWFKSAIGWFPAGGETPRVESFCAHVVADPEQLLVVPDARQDPRFALLSSVTGSPGIRFYAGVPIISAEGHALGSFCVIDVVPRSLTDTEHEILKGLASAATSVLDLHRSVAELRESEDNYRHAVELSPHIAWTADPDGWIASTGRRWTEVTGLPVLGIGRRGWRAAVHPDDLPATDRRWSESLESGKPFDIEYRLRGRDHGYRWFRAYAAPRRDADGRIVRWYGTVEDIHDRKLSQQRLEYLVDHDALTGLLNREGFHKRLEREAALARSGLGLTLVALDLDHFKALNETLGHQVGDAVVQIVGDRLKACMSADDAGARVDGDEFLLILTGAASPDQAALAAERLLAAVAAPMEVSGHHLTIGASLGVVLCPRDGCLPDQLLQNADLALFRAKADGRQTFRLFERTMDEKLRRELALRIDLREALERSEFELAYQPIMGLRSGRLEGLEALLRWRHPAQGMVPPSTFIPIAETTGAILPIGRWVLEEACREAARWPAPTRVAVNLSPVQFGERDLARQIGEVLAASGLEPDRLELEITESVRLLDNDKNLSVLQDLRELGVRMVLDDFGTGYASLSYLQRFKFDKLKIDRSFVDRIAQDDGAREIVRAILAMARALNITTTAEGIETPDQLAFLIGQGCDQIQGYLIGRPVTPAAVPEVLARL